VTDDLPQAPQDRADTGSLWRLDLPGVAVLPLQSPGDGIIRSYFADGLTSQIIGSLARIPDLMVIAAGTMLRYRSRKAEIRAVGAELGVRFVVSGTITRHDQRLTFNHDLWDATDGGLMWTDSVEANLDDLFEVECWIVARIVNGILPMVREAEIARAMLKPASSLTAYDLMLQALPELQKLEQAGLRKASALLDQAMTLDPGYGMAQAWGARLRCLNIGQGWSLDRARDTADALRLARSAVASDPGSSLALATAGHLHSYLLHDYASARPLFERAIAACHNDALALSLSSLTLAYCGEGARAREQAQRAMRLSPMDPFLHMHCINLALAYYVEGEYACAEAWSRRSLAENPRFTSSHKLLAAALVGQGRVSEARAVAHELLRLEPAFGRQTDWSPPMQDRGVRDLYIRQLRTAGALPAAAKS